MLIFSIPQRGGDGSKTTWNLFLEYKGYIFVIGDAHGGEIEIATLQKIESPKEVAKELREIIEYLIHNEDFLCEHIIAAR